MEGEGALHPFRRSLRGREQGGDETTRLGLVQFHRLVPPHHLGGGFPHPGNDKSRYGTALQTGGMFQQSLVLLGEAGNQATGAVGGGRHGRFQFVRQNVTHFREPCKNGLPSVSVLPTLRRMSMHIGSHCFPFLILVFSLRIVVAQEQEATPAIVAFAEKLTDVTWDLRGTNSLKCLRFDGEAMRPVRGDGSVGGAYETFFPEEGIVRILFTDGTSGWYFISDDFRFMTSVKVLVERAFALPEGTEAKSVAAFPKDIEGVVYESTDEHSGHPLGKLRWNGENLEIGAFRDGAWAVESARPAVALRRVFEMRTPEGEALWFVFSADGSEAWFLQLEGIFGGHRSDLPAKEAVAEAQSGLTPQFNDLANHMMDLIDAGEKPSVGTLQRQFERRLKGKPELLERLKQRVNAR